MHFTKMGAPILESDSDVNEEPKPSTSELKGVHHTNSPFGYVGWGRV